MGDFLGRFGTAARLATLALALPLAGCSVVFVRGPAPPSERTRPVECTTSPLAPVLDLAWVGYALAATAAEKTGGIGAEDVALSTIWVGSAAYGVVNIDRCHSAHRDAERAAERARAAYEASRRDTSGSAF